MAKEKELITAQALADALDLSVETIWRYTRNSKIPYVELGSRQYRYKIKDVMAALTGERVGAAGGDAWPDYPLLHEKGARYEALEGQLVAMPSPDVAHQRAISALLVTLVEYFRQIDPRGEVFVAPLDVAFENGTVVQPDIIYVSGAQLDIIKEKLIEGVPTLVVEVMSAAGRSRDRVQKIRVYQKAGVQHCWLADSGERTIECFALGETGYALVAAGMEDDVVEHPDFAGLSVLLATLWR